MYIPKSFAVEDAETLYAFMQQHNFATLVTHQAGNLFATALPFMVDAERGMLKAHLARANPQWKHFDESEAMVLFQGPHAYVSPAWYETHPSVPTWNYTAVHVYGVPRIIEDETMIRDMLRELVENHEQGRTPEWQMALPEDYLEKMLKAIVVFEVPMTRVEGKFKMSQNRSTTDQQSVMEHLAASSFPEDRATARVMQQLNVPQP